MAIQDLNIPIFVRTTKDKYTAKISSLKTSIGSDLSSVDNWSTWTNEAKKQAGKEYANSVYFCTDTSEIYHREVMYGASAEDKAAIDELMNEVFPLVVSASVSTAIYEKGTVAHPVLTITIKKKGVTVPIGTNAGEATVTVNGTSVTTNSYTDTSDVSSNKSYSVIVKLNGSTIQKSASASVSFYNRKYLGTTTKTTLSGTDVRNLENNTWATSDTYSETTLNCQGGKYIVFAAPVSVINTTPAFWVGGLLVTDITESTVQVTNASGFTESYKVYRLNTLLNSTSVSVQIK